MGRSGQDIYYTEKSCQNRKAKGIEQGTAKIITEFAEQYISIFKISNLEGTEWAK